MESFYFSCQLNLLILIINACVYFIKLLPKHKNKNTRYWLSVRAKTSLLMRGKPFHEFLLLKLLLINAKPQTPNKSILQAEVKSYPLSAPCLSALCSPTLHFLALGLPSSGTSFFFQLLVSLVILALEDMPLMRPFPYGDPFTPLANQ